MKKIGILLLIIVVIAGAAYIAKKRYVNDSTSPLVTEDKPGTDTIAGAEMTKTYEDTDYNFSFKYPESFSVNVLLNEMPDQSGKSIVVQNSQGQGFQMRISPTDGDVVELTPERIRQDIPDLTIDEPREVLIGDGGKGLAFLSDNETFIGGSREVWFVYQKNLYQVSTYKRYDPFLQAVFATWQFK